MLDLTLWPLPEQEAEARAKRRIGLGFTGLGDALILLGLSYDSAAARETAAAIARELRDSAYGASVDLARERGPFPLLDPDRYGRSPYIQRLPEGLQAGIRTHGIRNSHLLSIAPTGTISLAFADNASNGIEPPYAWSYRRRVRLGEGTRDYRVEDPAYRFFRARFGAEAPLPEAFVCRPGAGAGRSPRHGGRRGPLYRRRDQQDAESRSRLPAGATPWPSPEAWRLGLKGLAVFRPSGARSGVLTAGSEAEACELTAGPDPEPQSGPRCPRCDPFELDLDPVDHGPQGLGALTAPPRARGGRACPSSASALETLGAWLETAAALILTSGPRT